MKTILQTTTAKAKTNKNVYAKDPEAEIIRERTFHLNDEEETEIDQTETVEGKINRFPLGLEYLEMGIHFQPGKSREILTTMEKSGKIIQNIGIKK